MSQFCPAFVYPFAAIRCRPVVCILCWQNNGLLFNTVQPGSPSARNSVATALRRTKKERDRQMAGGSGLTRGTVALTHRSIEALRPAQTPYRVSDQRCVGLAVRVAPSGLKTWDLAYRIRGSGKVRRVSLGRIVDVSLLGSQQTTNGIVAMSRDKTQP
jgi:hypothetical protein